MSLSKMPTDPKAMALEKELLAALTQTSYVAFVDPILYSTIREGFHVYYSANTTPQKMRAVAEYVKQKYDFNYTINVKNKHCCFYRPKI
jgi:hypothetical protein